MNPKIQKRLAAKVLKVGETRVWIDPESKEEVSKAITRGDIKSLIVRNVIQAKPKKGISRGRAKELHEQRKKGRRKGHGRRKGAKTARTPKKEAWINKIRPLRRILKALRNKEVLSSVQYRELYNKAKGNFFRNSNHLKSHIEKMLKG